MNKKQFLTTYKKIDSLDNTSKSTDTNQIKIYKSEHDERLIKDFHYAKFQKNLNSIQTNKEFRELIEKKEWDESDIEKLITSLR